jgi:CYTH domain-containing protein
MVPTEGLTVAEIELESESETFWNQTGLEEVTNDNRYYNSNLSNNHLKIGAYFLKNSIVTVITPVPLFLFP